MSKTNFNEKITNLYGRTIPKSNPSKEELAELEKYPKIPDGKGGEILDFTKLPDETLGNFLIACLSVFKPQNGTERFFTNIVAEVILNAENGEAELKDKYKKFLIDVLDSVTLHTEKTTKRIGGRETETTVEVGKMRSWATTKAKLLLGYTPETIE